MSDQAAPTSTRRINAAGRLLAEDPADVLRVLNRLDADQLANLGEAVTQLQRERAVASGDHDAIIAAAFETGFGRDGMGVLPWVEGDVVVCPGAIISKSQTNHRCRFISVNDTWIWDSHHLIREDKRSSPGEHDGFRAVALVPVQQGLELDVVTGRAQRGQHAVEHVVSFAIRRRKLVEVSQRTVAAAGMK